MKDVKVRNWYKEEWGECSLNNPKVRERLVPWVWNFINFHYWISKKNFTDPEEIFLNVQEDIKDIPVSEYGKKEGIEPIFFIMRKVKTRIGKDWWEYLKTMSPQTYDQIRGRGAPPGTPASLEYQREYYHKHVKGTEKNKKNNYDAQKKLRDSIGEPYCVASVYKDLQQRTGLKYKFSEIREQFPHLINETRERLKNGGNKKSDAPVILPELDDYYVARAVQQILNRKGLKITATQAIVQFPELIIQKRIELEKEREGYKNIIGVPFRILGNNRNGGRLSEFKERLLKMSPSELEEERKTWHYRSMQPNKNAICNAIESFSVVTLSDHDTFYMLHVGVKAPIRFEHYEEAVAEAKEASKKSKKSVFITKSIKTVEYKKYAV